MQHFLSKGFISWDPELAMEIHNKLVKEFTDSNIGNPEGMAENKIIKMMINGDLKRKRPKTIQEIGTELLKNRKTRKI